MIDGLTIFAWLVLALLFGVLVAAIVAIGSLPKKIASKRNHPQVDAINAASWVGLLMGGVGWLIAFVWAFTKSGELGYSTPGKSESANDEVSRLRARVVELEASLAERGNDVTR